MTLRRSLSLLLILMPLLLWLGRPPLAQAQTDQAVYTDALVNGWQNWSWATVNLSNTAPVQSGTDSISVSAGPYQALYLHQPPSIPPPYTSLVFWINGGPTGGQLLQVQATLNGAAQTVVTLPALAANTWQQVTLPLSSLGVQNQPDLDGFWIQDRSGTTQPTFFVDTISIKAQPPPSVVNVTVNAAQPVRIVDRAPFCSQHRRVGRRLRHEQHDQSADLDGRAGAALPRRLALRRLPLGHQHDRQQYLDLGYLVRPILRRSPPRSARKPSSPSTTDRARQPKRPHGSRQSNVTNHYGFKYWEIGNECYGTWETDTNTVAHDPYTYAQRFQQYYTQMKAVDPTIKIGAVAVTGEDSYANNTNHPVVNPRTGQTHNGWTPVMLATLAQLSA